MSRKNCFTEESYIDLKVYTTNTTSMLGTIQSVLCLSTSTCLDTFWARFMNASAKPSFGVKKLLSRLAADTENVWMLWFCYWPDGICICRDFDFRCNIYRKSIYLFVWACAVSRLHTPSHIANIHKHVFVLSASPSPIDNSLCFACIFCSRLNGKLKDPWVKDKKSHFCIKLILKKNILYP